MGIFLGYGFSLGLVGSGVGLVPGPAVRPLHQRDCRRVWMAHRPADVRSARSIISTRFPRSSVCTRWCGSWLGAWRSPCWPACCRRGVPRGCIPWRPCVMNSPTDASPAPIVVVRSCPLAIRTAVAQDMRTVAAAEQPPTAKSPSNWLAHGSAQELSQGQDRRFPCCAGSTSPSAGRVHGDRRPERLGQEHAAAPAGHARCAGPRRNPFRGPADRQPARRPSAIACATAIWA